MDALPSPPRQTGRCGSRVGSVGVGLDRNFPSLDLSLLASKIKELKRRPLRSLPGNLCDLGRKFPTDVCVLTLSRESRLREPMANTRAQCKMKRQGPLSKIIKTYRTARAERSTK